MNRSVSRGADGSGLALVEKATDLHQVPDEPIATSDDDTLGIPVCNECSN